jgi:hypothetical protein
MQDRRQEIEGLVNSFWATLQPIVSRYRGMEQSDENVVQHFATRVETERARYARKFEALRSDTSCKDLGELIASVERQINNMADHEIARARADGKVEHVWFCRSNDQRIHRAGNSGAHRISYGPGCCRSHRRSQVCLRHMGRHGKYSEPYGIPLAPGPDSSLTND